MRNSLLATAATPFAHLLRGKTAPVAQPAPAAPGAKAEGDEEETEEEKKERERKEANKAAGRDEDDDGEGGENDKKGKGAKKAKSKKAEGDDSSDDEDSGDTEAHAVRLRERGRCAAIFACDAAAIRPDVAAQLAFGTNMNRAQAIITLQAVAAGERDPAPQSRSSLRQSMETVKMPNLGGGAIDQTGQDPAAATAAAIIAAGKKRRGEAV